MYKLPLQNIHAQGRKIYLSLRDKNGNLSIKSDNSFYPYFFELSDNPNSKWKGYDDTPLRIVKCQTPYEVSKIRSDESYESDILYPKRYLIDRIDEILPSPIKYLFIDVECLILEDGKEPIPEKNPITCIALYNSFTKLYHCWFIGDYKGNLKGRETQMFKGFINYLKTEKPDMMLGWNWNEFDYPYIYNRILHRYNKKFSELISPIKQSRRGEHDVLYPALVSQVDYLGLYRKTFPKKLSYNLNDTMEDELGAGKEFEDIDFSKITPDIKERCLGDVRGMVGIENKRNLISQYDEIRRISMIYWEDLPMKVIYSAYGLQKISQNSRFVDMLALKEAKEMNIRLPKKNYDKERQKYKGAEREAEYKGRFADVAQFDYSGAYPQAIIDFCLDPTNIIKNPKEYKGKYPIVKINDTYFIQNPDKILPRICKKFLTLKNKFRDLKNNISKDDKEFDNIKQYYEAVKAICNSIYGVFALPTFRLYNIKVASATTFLVGNSLLYVVNKLKGMNYNILYYDSVSKDTPVIIKENNEIKIIPIEDLSHSQSRYYVKKRDNLENKNIEILTVNGFKKIKYIYRHKCNKKMYRILTRKGYIECSKDHSLIINNKKVSPEELKVGDFIELKDFNLPTKYDIYLDLAWLIGFWLAEGSCYVNYKTNKYHWKIDNQDLNLLRKAQYCLKKYGINGHIINCMKSSQVFRLSTDIKAIAELFYKWCLTRNKEKKIPPFILESNLKSKKAFFEGYYAGDGNKSINKKNYNYKCFDSVDKSLASGLCLILNQLGKEYSLSIRNDKLNVIKVNIISNPNDKRVKKYNQIKKIETYMRNDVIYDIETESHIFCGGIGNINLHNTDGFKIQGKKDISKLANKLVQDWALEKFNKKIDLAFDYEGYYTAVFIKALTHYIGQLQTDKGIEERVKGVEAKRSNATKYVKRFQKELILKVLERSDDKWKYEENDMVNWIRDQIVDFKNQPLDMIAFPVSLKRNPEDYTKKKEIFIRALENTTELIPDFDKKVGSLFWWIHVIPEKTNKITEIYLNKMKIVTIDKDISKKEIVDNIEEYININDFSGDIKKALRVLHKKKTPKDVMAFDKKTKTHIDNIDWKVMIEKNIMSKVRPIFEVLGWDYKKISGGV